jgi:hypothetical protein
MSASIEGEAIVQLDEALGAAAAALAALRDCELALDGVTSRTHRMSLLALVQVGALRDWIIEDRKQLDAKPPQEGPR